MKSLIKSSFCKIELMIFFALPFMQCDAQKIQNPELLNATKVGNLIRVKELIEKGADVNFKDKDSMNALIWASYSGYNDIVKLLIENKTEINAKGRLCTMCDNETALSLAASSGYLEIVKLLLNNGADIKFKTKDKKTALTAAISQGHIEIVKLLLEKGAEVERNILSQIWYTDNLRSRSSMSINDYHKKIKSESENNLIPELVKLLIEKGADVNVKSDRYQTGGKTPLTWAVENNQTDFVKLLIEKGADVNMLAGDGTFALMEAVRLGNIKIIKLLLEKGAKINSSKVLSEAIGSSVTSKRINNVRGTPMNQINTIEVIDTLRTEIVKLLIESGADVNRKESSDVTPLMNAVEKGNKEIIELLIRKGADVDAKMSNGETSLMQATRQCNIEMVKLLIEKKADVNVIDNYGLTSLGLAKSNRNSLSKECSEIINLLIAAGAR